MQVDSSLLGYQFLFNFLANDVASVTLYSKYIASEQVKVNAEMLLVKRDDFKSSNIKLLTLKIAGV